ncbi:MAG: hypothetical protein GY777_10500 [Candidatus Brocadiaceae bacterium]|nr:hypothetical protein [Candidatus Brocadiaceae bacterium]
MLDTVRTMIQENDLEAAIEELITYLSDVGLSRRKNEAMLHAAAITRVKDGIRTQTIPVREANQEQSRICNSILELLEIVEKEICTLKKSSPSVPGKLENHDNGLSSDVDLNLKQKSVEEQLKENEIHLHVHAEANPTIVVEANANASADVSMEINLEIRNTVNLLQGNLNELAQLLTDGGKNVEATELENAAKALEQVENSKNKEEVKKKGIANRLKRLLDDLNNKESKLYNTVKGIKNGISIAQDIAKGYNDTAQWLGLPQVPKPFLK